MPTESTIRLREYPRPAQLLVTGEIDTLTVAKFRDALTQAVTRHDRLVVDLTRTRFLSGTALAALHEHTDRITALLVRRDSPIIRALRIAGLDTLVAYRGTARPRRRPICWSPARYDRPPARTQLTR
ncbi:MAG TPA: STAS domain-containing protein [Pseudonocardia sp.]|jgi:anti-anti-sigma factor|nr:STAS domain-containing protein [Pseudonocardia sp.]